MSTDYNIERAYLGILLLDPRRAQDSTLTRAHFDKAWHAELFEALTAREWSSMDAVVLHMADHPATAKACGGVSYVMQHAEEAPSIEGAHTYEEALRVRLARKQIAAAAVEAQAMSYDGCEPFELAASVRAKIDAIDSGASSIVESPRAGAQDVLRDICEEASGDRSPYIQTGIGEWDGDWVGVPSEGVLLFLARSGMGKTSLINSFAVALAVNGSEVYVHGTETSANKRNRAIIFGMAGVSPRQWGHLTLLHAEGRLHGRELDVLNRCHDRLMEAAEERAKLPIHVTGSGLSCERVVAEARRLVRGGVKAVFIDYVQDFPFSKGIDGNRTAQIGHHSRMLKDASASLRVPFFVAAQVSGEKDGIPNKGQVVPQMWDAQWASGLHQDAEEVYAINRGDYWQQRLTDADGEVSAMFTEERFGVVGVVDIHARKRREGALGHIALAWDGPRRWVGPIYRTLDERRMRG